jgi:hypothetical protein
VECDEAIEAPNQHCGECETEVGSPMTKGDETRLRNLHEKEKVQRLTALEKGHLKRLSKKKRAEAQPSCLMSEHFAK